MGSLTSFGSVRLSGITSPAPSGTTVFSGDTIDTGVASAIFTLNSGDAIFMGANASIKVSKTQEVPSVEMVRGMSRVQMRSKDLRLTAANWTLEASGRTTADVLRDSDGTISLNVKEGELRAKDSRGRTMLAQAGRPVLLPGNPDALPSADSPAPQQGGGSGSGSGSGSGKGVSGKTIGAYVLAAAAIGVAAAAIAGRSDNTDILATVNTLSAQNAALQKQVQALLTQLSALNSFVAGQQALIAKLASLIGQLNTAETQLATIQTSIATILAKVAAGTQTPADLATLATLQTQQAALSVQISSLTGQAADIIAQIQGLKPPVSPTLP